VKLERNMEWIADTLLQMSRGRRSLRDTQATSPEGSEEDEAMDAALEQKSPTIKAPPAGRGRQGQGSRSASLNEPMDVTH